MQANAERTITPRFLYAGVNDLRFRQAHKDKESRELLARTARKASRYGVELVEKGNCFAAELARRICDSRAAYRIWLFVDTCIRID
eukprot:3791103-Pleurochrysis_carterae.AAC.1